MRGRPGDEWQKQLAAKPLPEMVQGVAYAGFQGIYVDRFGYADLGVGITSQLSALLSEPPLESSDKRFAFFPMGKYAQAANAAPGGDQRRAEALKQPVMVTLTGCTEGGAPGNYWCPYDGAVEVVNPGQDRRTVRVAAVLQTATGDPGTVAFTGSLYSKTLRIIQKDGVPLSMELVVPPGRHAIKFHCDAKKLQPAGDPRVLVLAVLNFQTSSN